MAAHQFKVTKQQARIYTSCCGLTAEFYTSKEFGLPASAGWYITDNNGNSGLDRFATLGACKRFMSAHHVNYLLNIIEGDIAKVGA